MNQDTEKERAEFEAAYVNIRKAESVSLTERDVKDWILRLDESGIYADPNSRMAFALWQAARRVQVVPYELRNAAQRAHDWMERQAKAQGKGGHATFDLMMLREERDALAAALAA